MNNKVKPLDLNGAKLVKKFWQFVDYSDQLNALADGRHIVIDAAELKALRRVLKAAEGIRADLLERADMDQESARRVVAVGNSAWFDLCDAIRAARAKEPTNG